MDREMDELQSALEDVFHAIKKIAGSQADNMLPVQKELLEITSWLGQAARGLTVAIIDVATQKNNTDDALTEERAWK